MKLSQLILLLFFSVSLCRAAPSLEQSWFLASVNTPKNILSLESKEKVVIAIVDDGIRVTHDDLKDYIWTNPNEVAGNGIDDEGNGMIDDVHGWDVADHNNSVYPPRSRLKQYYHGTHLAGIIAQIARLGLGNSAVEHIQLLPVKALADTAPDTYLREAYKGIEYAINAGADIILTAWGVGPISKNEARILEEAEKKGILIIAAAGNFSEEKKQYPAAYPSVMAVAALNSDDKKIAKSNFGQFVDISAPGEGIYSASALSDTERSYQQGTSFSAAITAAAAALVKLKHPAFGPEEIKACLKSSASDLTEINPIYSGKLGAGKLNIKAAVDCSFFGENQNIGKDLTLPQGFLRVKSSSQKKVFWQINPAGEFKGLRFSVVGFKGDVGKSVLNLYSKSDLKRANLMSSYPLASLPENFYIPNTSVFISLENENKKLEFEGLIHYEAETIDFTTLYCKETVYLNTEGSIEDGSGHKNYSFHSNCKWLITAPEGKVIKIKFSELDTESRVDLIYFFDGPGTHESIMAIFSGNQLPPELITWHNQVLVWFVSDEKKQGEGWKATFRFVDQ